MCELGDLLEIRRNIAPVLVCDSAPQGPFNVVGQFVGLLVVCSTSCVEEIEQGRRVILVLAVWADCLTGGRIAHPPKDESKVPPEPCQQSRRGFRGHQMGGIKMSKMKMNEIELNWGLCIK